jgi:hypothetical protein
MNVHQNQMAMDLLKKEGYGAFPINLPDHIAFQKGYCNCDSSIGELIEMKGIPYHEAKAIKKQEALNRLYQIRDFMMEPDYQEMKESFMQKCEKLCKELESYFHKWSKR